MTLELLSAMPDGISLKTSDGSACVMTSGECVSGQGIISIAWLGGESDVVNVRANGAI